MKRVASMVVIASLAACGGSGGGSSTTPPCDAVCQDGVAILALRNAIKDVYNVKVQGQPVGPQNATTICGVAGMASVSGTATSNADQGTTTVNLTYVFSQCEYSAIDTDPTQTFDLTLDGTVTEVGTIAVQPSSTTALDFSSVAVSLEGSVYAGPAIPYTATSCPLKLGQNGNDLSGTMCGRVVGTTL